MKSKQIMIIAGEASGDIHGAKLVNAMKQKDNTLCFYGIGGNALKNAGVRILVDASTLSVVGITEVFSKLPTIVKGMNTAKAALKTLNPDILILIDFPDFNLRVAQAAKKLGIRVLYYISPQIWAWRPGRVKKIGRLVDHVAVIFPFEEQFYKKYKIPVTYVGHPLLDQEFSELNHKSHHNPQNNNSNTYTIGLLPGSRDKEIASLLPIMLEAAKILNNKMNNVKFILSVAPTVEQKTLESIITKHWSMKNISFICNDVKTIFEQSCFVIAASGTITLQAAIFGTPMVIIYKVSAISYLLGKALIKVKNIGLVNLVAGKQIVPELIQYQASPENIAETVYKIVKDQVCLKRLQNELLKVKDILGGPGASKRVANLALNMLYK